MNRNGAAVLESRISSVLSQQVTFEQGIPEFGASFDRYSGPARLDIGISGQTGSGDSLFVGVEAKVDEPFGSTTVCKTYQYALRKRNRGERTNAPERVEGLLSRYFSDSAAPCDSGFSDIRYQLLTSSAGTIAAGNDVSVFYVVVFRTALYDEEKGRENYHDYENFVNRAEGRLLMQGRDGTVAHELSLDGRRLICIYEYVDVDTEG